MALTIFVIMIVLLLLGFPMMIPLIAAAFVGFFTLFGGFSQLETMVQQMMAGIRPASLIAVPMFIFAADIMTRGQSADRLIELIENDGIIARSKLGISGSPALGSHVFVLNGAHNETRGMHWSAISHHHEAGAGPGSSDIMRRLQADNSFVQAMTRRLHPGMIFITTDAPLTPDRRSGRDFVIATS